MRIQNPTLRTPIIVALAIVLAMISAAVSPFTTQTNSATEPGSISGTLIPDSDVPMNPSMLNVFAQAVGQWSRTYGFIQADGAYTISNLTTGEYTVRVQTISFAPTGPQNPYANTWAPGSPSSEYAATIKVSDGEVVTGVDISMLVGGTITGIVSAATGEPPTGTVRVTAQPYQNSEIAYSRSTLVDELGAYTIVGLGQGEYTVIAESISGGNYVSTWHPTARTLSTATQIFVGPMLQADNVDIEMPIGGTITGKISPGAHPIDLSMVRITAHSNENDFNGTGTSVIDANGNYRISGIATGSYKLQARPLSSVYVPTWHESSSNYYGAAAVEVIEGFTTENKNFSMQLGATISGRVLAPDGTPIAGARVEAVPTAPQPSWSTIYSVTSDSLGNYISPRVPAGEYRFRAWPPNSQTFIDNWLMDPENGTPAALSLNAGETLEGIDISLRASATITGRVLDQNTATPLSNLNVMAYEVLDADTPSEFQRIFSSTTDASGNYEIGGMHPGSYSVIIFDYQGSSHYGAWEGTSGSSFDPALLIISEGDVVHDIDISALTAPDQAVPAPAPEVTVTLTSESSIVRWSKAESDEPVIGYEVELSFGWAGDGFTLLGPDALSYLFRHFESGPEQGTSTVWTVRAITPSGTGFPGTTVSHQPGSVDLHAAPTIAIVESSDTSLTVSASSNTGTFNEWRWSFLMTGDPNSINAHQHAESVEPNALATFTGLTPGRPYAVYAAWSNELGEVSEWAAMLNVILPSTSTWPPGSSPAPTVTGTPTVGSILNGTLGQWDPAPTSIAYQWMRSDAAIPGAVASSYTLGTADVGHQVSLSITASREGYLSATRVSVPTARVAVAPTPEPPETPESPRPTPVYRFWSDSKQGHFYTLSQSERDHVIATYPRNVWQYEGPAYLAFGKQAAGTVPLYRFWSDRYQGHFYTTSASERDHVIATYPRDVWQYEMVAYYVYPAETSVDDTLPVARFWSDTKMHHFYTASAAEAAHVKATYPREVWAYELDAFKVPTR